MLEIIVLASGRGSNLIAIQEAIESGSLDGRIKAVISNRKDARALAYASDKGIEALWLDPGRKAERKAYDSRLYREVERIGSDCLVLAGYDLLLDWAYFRQYNKPVLNIHPALLPSFPGMTAQKDALEYGVKISGCTVHFVDAGMDTGPIIAQRTVAVLDSDDEETLAARILEEEHKLYPEVLSLLAQGKLRREGRRVRIEPESTALSE